MSVPFRHIACCVDDSEGGRDALAMARSLRALGPGRLSLVRVAPRPLLFLEEPDGGRVPDPRDLWTRSRDWLRSQAREGEEPVLLEGDPPSTACRWAAGTDVDLMVASAHRTPVQRALLGGFASHLAYNAPCPVLLVRPERGEEG